MVGCFDGALARWHSKLHADLSLSCAAAAARRTARRHAPDKRNGHSYLGKAPRRMPTQDFAGFADNYDGQGLTCGRSAD
ncbi:hypothetical protein KQH49_14030 [Mycetohabitans sp. B5]|uniref:Uncharacterized protein n=1 Tax=Mycetohabitans endofungorum TaxID=417203 RepID=A0A2P5K6S7_9BURK|nr:MULTISPECIES: hypothetical protein [Mycetohabitans]MCG1055982.1 hypothetical protein [Mycetohabitans sp. B5]PPB81037.1 hypothetical protein B0O95_12322 [Mycetohabitans endofungorum]